MMEVPRDADDAARLSAAAAPIPAATRTDAMTAAAGLLPAAAPAAGTAAAFVGRAVKGSPGGVFASRDNAAAAEDPPTQQRPLQQQQPEQQPQPQLSQQPREQQQEQLPKSPQQQQQRKVFSFFRVAFPGGLWSSASRAAAGRYCSARRNGTSKLTNLAWRSTHGSSNCSSQKNSGSLNSSGSGRSSTNSNSSSRTFLSSVGPSKQLVGSNCSVLEVGGRQNDSPGGSRSTSSSSEKGGEDGRSCADMNSGGGASSGVAAASAAAEAGGQGRSRSAAATASAAGRVAVWKPLFAQQLQLVEQRALLEPLVGLAREWGAAASACGFLVYPALQHAQQQQLQQTLQQRQKPTQQQQQQQQDDPLGDEESPQQQQTAGQEQQQELQVAGAATVTSADSAGTHLVAGEAHAAERSSSNSGNNGSNLIHSRVQSRSRSDNSSSMNWDGSALLRVALAGGCAGVAAAAVLTGSALLLAERGTSSVADYIFEHASSPYMKNNLGELLLPVVLCSAAAGAVCSAAAAVGVAAAAVLFAAVVVCQRKVLQRLRRVAELLLMHQKNTRDILRWTQEVEVLRHVVDRERRCAAAAAQEAARASSAKAADAAAAAAESATATTAEPAPGGRQGEKLLATKGSPLSEQEGRPAAAVRAAAAGAANPLTGGDLAAPSLAAAAVSVAAAGGAPVVTLELRLIFLQQVALLQQYLEDASSMLLVSDSLSSLPSSRGAGNNSSGSTLCSLGKRFWSGLWDCRSNGTSGRDRRGASSVWRSNSVWNSSSNTAWGGGSVWSPNSSTWGGSSSTWGSSSLVGLSTMKDAAAAVWTAERRFCCCVQATLLQLSSAATRASLWESWVVSAPAAAAAEGYSVGRPCGPVAVGQASCRQKQRGDALSLLQQQQQGRDAAALRRRNRHNTRRPAWRQGPQEELPQQQLPQQRTTKMEIKQQQQIPRTLDEELRACSNAAAACGGVERSLQACCSRTSTSSSNRGNAGQVLHAADSSGGSRGDGHHHSDREPGASTTVGGSNSSNSNTRTSIPTNSSSRGRHSSSSSLSSRRRILSGGTQERSSSSGSSNSRLVNVMSGCRRMWQWLLSSSSSSGLSDGAQWAWDRLLRCIQTATVAAELVENCSWQVRQLLLVEEALDTAERQLDVCVTSLQRALLTEWAAAADAAPACRLVSEILSMQPHSVAAATTTASPVYHGGAPAAAAGSRAEHERAEDDAHRTAGGETAAEGRGLGTATDVAGAAAGATEAERPATGGVEEGEELGSAQSMSSNKNWQQPLQVLLAAMRPPAVSPLSINAAGQAADVRLSVGRLSQHIGAALAVLRVGSSEVPPYWSSSTYGSSTHRSTSGSTYPSGGSVLSNGNSSPTEDPGKVLLLSGRDLGGLSSSSSDSSSNGARERVGGGRQTRERWMRWVGRLVSRLGVGRVVGMGLLLGDETPVEDQQQRQPAAVQRLLQQQEEDEFLAAMWGVLTATQQQLLFAQQQCEVLRQQLQQRQQQQQGAGRSGKCSPSSGGQQQQQVRAGGWVRQQQRQIEERQQSPTDGTLWFAPPVPQTILEEYRGRGDETGRRDKGTSSGLAFSDFYTTDAGALACGRHTLKELQQVLQQHPRWQQQRQQKRLVKELLPSGELLLLQEADLEEEQQPQQEQVQERQHSDVDGQHQQLQGERQQLSSSGRGSKSCAFSLPVLEQLSGGDASNGEGPSSSSSGMESKAGGEPTRENSSRSNSSLPLHESSNSRNIPKDSSSELDADFRSSFGATAAAAAVRGRQRLRKVQELLHRREQPPLPAVGSNRNSSGSNYRGKQLLGTVVKKGTNTTFVGQDNSDNRTGGSRNSSGRISSSSNSSSRTSSSRTCSSRTSSWRGEVSVADQEGGGEAERWGQQQRSKRRLLHQQRGRQDDPAAGRLHDQQQEQEAQHASAQQEEAKEETLPSLAPQHSTEEVDDLEDEEVWVEEEEEEDAWQPLLQEEEEAAEEENGAIGAEGEAPLEYEVPAAAADVDALSGAGAGGCADWGGGPWCLEGSSSEGEQAASSSRRSRRKTIKRRGNKKHSTRSGV